MTVERRDELAIAIVGVIVGTVLFAAVSVVLDVAWWRAILAAVGLGAGGRCFTEAAIAARNYRKGGNR